MNKELASNCDNLYRLVSAALGENDEARDNLREMFFAVYRLGREDERKAQNV